MMHETKWLDRVDRKDLTKVLGELMSVVSQDTHCAGWLMGTEFFVPELCKRVLKTNRANPWGFGELGPGMAAVLQTIADKLGHWATTEERGPGYVPFNPFPIPKEYLAELDHCKLKKEGSPDMGLE